MSTFVRGEFDITFAAWEGCNHRLHLQGVCDNASNKYDATATILPHEASPFAVVVPPPRYVYQYQSVNLAGSIRQGLLILWFILGAQGPAIYGGGVSGTGRYRKIAQDSWLTYLEMRRIRSTI